MLAVFLRRMGHHADFAVDGAQAVERFSPESFDLVIMDVMMPIMDGYEATRRIKSRCGDRWVPVIFLSALDNDDSLVKGLEAGGDDYLTKPVNFVVLEAKLRAISRTIFLRRELEEAHRSLQVYHDAHEEENRLSADIFTQLMERPGLSDPLLRYWLHPASHFSGDIAAAARSPDGRLYILLADATGHGLAAAISVLPILTLFYDSVDRSPPLGAMLDRINSQLYESLPVERCVACTGLCIDPATGRCEIWNGGLPPALLIDADGRLLRTLPSTQVSLGVVEFGADACAVESLYAPPGAQLVLFSDGLIETCNSQGEPFGMERLLATIASASRADRLSVIQDAVMNFAGCVAPHDDVTIMLIDLPAHTPITEEPPS